MEGRAGEDRSRLALHQTHYPPFGQEQTKYNVRSSDIVRYRGHNPLFKHIIPPCLARIRQNTMSDAKAFKPPIQTIRTPIKISRHFQTVCIYPWPIWSMTMINHRVYINFCKSFFPGSIFGLQISGQDFCRTENYWKPTAAKKVAGSPSFSLINVKSGSFLEKKIISTDGGKIYEELEFQVLAKNFLGSYSQLDFYGIVIWAYSYL